MKIALGADHAAFAMKQELVQFLQTLSCEVLDCGTHSIDSVDYPDYAQAVGEAVMKRQADRGILLCGSGVGTCIAANKIPGVRAAICHDHYSAHQGVEHDDMNVLVLGARVVGLEVAKDLVATFLKATFSNDPRHRRRVDKVLKLEERYAGPQTQR